MDYVRLGRTGLQVSRLCLGTMPFGGQRDESTSVEILDAAWEAGITFIDTADVYPHPFGAGPDLVGRTEEILGRWLAGRRESVILATKCGGAMGPQPWRKGPSRRNILDAIDGSLRRLGTDYIDLYQVHLYDANVPHDETLAALDQLVHDGKVRYIGCTNYPASQVARAIGRSEALGISRFESVQPRYNLLYRNCERELFPLCLGDGVGCIPYNPLAGGLLTGKHHWNTPTEDTRFTYGSAASNYKNRYWHEREFATLEGLGGVADEAGISLATLSVAWCLANPAVTAPIIGASRPEQLAASVAALDHTLDEGLVALLSDITTEYCNHPAPL